MKSERTETGPTDFKIDLLKVEIDRLKNEINTIKTSLKASQDAERSANEVLEEYESLTVPTDGTFQLSTKVDVDTDAYVLKTPNGHVIVGENFATIVTRSDTKTVHF